MNRQPENVCGWYDDKSTLFLGGVLLGCLPHHSLWIVVAIMVVIPAVVVFAAVVFAPIAVISAVVVVVIAGVEEE